MLPMTIILRDLAIDARLGVFEWERAALREFSLTLELECRLDEAIRYDQLNATLDYTAIEAFTRRFALTQEWQLIERLLDALADALLTEFPPIRQLTLTFDKPQALEHARSAAVRLVRAR